MYVGHFIEPVQNLADLRMAILNSNEKKKLVDEIKKEFAADLAGHNKAENFNSILLKDIKHSFESKDINIKTDVDISSSGLYGISAPSGLGKSTALKILSGLLYSETAAAYIGGKDVKTLNPDSLNGNIFYINDKSIIFQGTVKENAELTEDAHITKEVFDSIFDESDNLSLETNLETEGTNISLGQKQRVVLLRFFALKEEPKIIILDEALSGLDEIRETQSIEALRKAFPHSIILFITHRKKSFALCDKVFEFKEV